MTSPNDELEATRLLKEALQTPEGTKQLFRDLAVFEATETYQNWCSYLGLDPRAPASERRWGLLHMIYVVAWRDLGEMFWRRLDIARSALLLGKI